MGPNIISEDGEEEIIKRDVKEMASVEGRSKASVRGTPVSGLRRRGTRVREFRETGFLHVEFAASVGPQGRFRK